jgi:prolyl 4-hydroxylase
MSTTQSQQQITPELRQWIVDQAQAGHGADAVLKSMIASGWSEEVAIAAMESTLRGHLETQAVAAGLPPAVPVPDPQLDDSPLYVDAGDRQVHVLQNMYQPRVVVFGNLLSDEECDELIALAKPRLARSLTVATKTGGEEVNDDRTSERHVLPARRAARWCASVWKRGIAKLLHWPEENGEGLQVLHYRPGAEYKPHYDYFRPQRAGHTHHPQARRPACGHLVMYLNSPQKGGGTTFPDVHLEVAPQARPRRVLQLRPPRTLPPRPCMAARRSLPARSGSPPSGCASGNSSKNMAPTLVTSCTSLPPGGASVALGRPGGDR